MSLLSLALVVKRACECLGCDGMMVDFSASSTRNIRRSALRQQHRAVESEINRLEHHGLNRGPDVGSKGYRR